MLVNFKVLSVEIVFPKNLKKLSSNSNLPDMVISSSYYSYLLKADIAP